MYPGYWQHPCPPPGYDQARVYPGPLPPPELLSWHPSARTASTNARILAILKAGGVYKYNLAEMLCTIIHGNKEEFSTYKDAFLKGDALAQLLNVLVRDTRGKAKFDAWLRNKKYAFDLVASDIMDEMETVKRSFFLTSREIEPETLINFDFENKVTGVLYNEAPTLQRILLSASQTKRALQENTMKDPLVPCSIICTQLANSRSKRSLYLQHAFGFFLYSGGASKLSIDVLSKCGISTAYNTIHEGHRQLSRRLLADAAEVAHRPHMLGFDNLQVVLSTHVAQRSLAPPKVRNCTSAIVYPLRNATLEDCQLRPILENRKRASIITYAGHIRPSSAVAHDLQEHQTINIIEILIQHHPAFRRLFDSPGLKHKAHRPPPDGHKSQEFICKTMPIDEATTDGCIKVIHELYIKQFGFGLYDLNNVAIPCINDQLTNSRLRSALLLRMNDVSPLARMENFQIGIGFFHLLMNFLWAIFITHRSTSSTPGSLNFYIALLSLTRLGTDKPDYYTLRTFMMNVLASHILVCWEELCGFPSLDDFANSMPSTITLKEIANQIQRDYASDYGLASCTDHSGVTDEVRRNAILLNRDLLQFYEIDAAVSSGDFGRVELSLGTLARMFSGAGSKNYSSEILHLIQNLTYVWPERFANVMRDNMLINMSGHPGHYIGVDMNIEHSINVQKRYFTSRGIHGTLEQLADLAPVTKVYRPLRKKFIEFTSSSWQGSRHSTADTSSYIQKVRQKAKECRIFDYDSTRSDWMSTVNTLQAGGTMLRTNGMKMFQQRYRSSVLVDGDLDFTPEEDEIPPNPIVVEHENSLLE